MSSGNNFATEVSDIYRKYANDIINFSVNNHATIVNLSAEERTNRVLAAIGIPVVSKAPISIPTALRSSAASAPAKATKGPKSKEKNLGIELKDYLPRTSENLCAYMAPRGAAADKVCALPATIMDSENIYDYRCNHCKGKKGKLHTMLESMNKPATGNAKKGFNVPFKISAEKVEQPAPAPIQVAIDDDEDSSINAVETNVEGINLISSFGDFRFLIKSDPDDETVKFVGKLKVKATENSEESEKYDIPEDWSNHTIDLTDEEIKMLNKAKILIPA